MKERVRRILIFTTIVGAGTLLIFIDLPLLLILPLIAAIGLILLILLGAIQISELKGAITSRFRKKEAGKPAAAGSYGKTAAAAAVKTPSGPTPSEKGGFASRFTSLFKKKAEKPAPVPAGTQPHKTASGAVPEKKRSFDIRSWFRKKPSAGPAAASPAIQKQPGATAANKRGLSLHFSSLVSSFRTFGTIIRTKKEADPDKLKKIDSMLDAAVHEKPSLSPAKNPAVPAPERRAAAPAPIAAGGAGAAATGPEPVSEDDPFAALQNDEFDASLLDGLDDDDGSTGTPAPVPEGESPEITITLPEEDLGIAVVEKGAEKEPETEPPLPPELAAAADDILKANDQDSGGLPALEGLESVDDNLGDLDNLNLDSVDLEDDDDTADDGPVPGFSEPAAPSIPVPEAAPAPAPAPASGAPSGKKGSDQSEMAAFASASGGDDDLISSLSAEIKTVKKEQDISLLRELKDFRAPGATIETELTELYTTLNAAAEKQKSLRPRTATPKKQAK